MGVVKEQSIRVTIITYVGVLVGAFNLLWLFPYFLSEEIIGLLKTIEAVAKIFFPFAALGVAAVCIRFFPKFRNSEQGHAGFLGVMLLFPLLGILAFLLFFFLFTNQIEIWYSENSPLFIQYLYWIIPLVLFFIYKNVLEAYTSSLKRTVMPSLIREVIMRVFFSGIAIAFGLHLIGLDQLVPLYVGGFGLVVLLLLLYVKWIGELSLKIDRQQWASKPLWKEVGNYAMYSLLTGTAWMMVANIDSLMITKFKGLEDTGIYSIALFLGTVIEIPRRAVSQISGAVVSDDIQAQRLDKVAKLYQTVSINQLLIGALFLVGIWVNIDNIFDLIPDEDYRAGKYVVLFIGLSRVFDMTGSINGDIITYSKYYRYNVFIITTLVGITFLTNYLLIPPLGITGAAIATALSILLFNLIKGILIWWNMGMQPLSKGTVKVIGIAGICLGLNSLLPYMGHFLLDIPIRSILVGGLFVALAYGWKVSEEANQLVNNVLIKVLKK